MLPEWPVFYEIFTTTTESCDFTEFENLARLNKRRKGKAREQVQSHLAVPQNVPAILRTLPVRYGHTGVNVRS